MIVRKVAKSNPTTIPSVAGAPRFLTWPNGARVPGVPWEESVEILGRPNEPVKVEVLGRPYEPVDAEILGKPYEPVGVDIAELFRPSNGTSSGFIDGVTFAVPTVAPIPAGFVTFAKAGPEIRVAG